MPRAGNEWQQPHRDSSLAATVRRLDLDNWGHRRRRLELSFEDGLTEILVLLEDLHGRFKLSAARQRLETRFRDFDSPWLIEISVNENRSVVGVIIKGRAVSMRRRRRPRRLSFLLRLDQFKREHSISSFCE